MLIKQAFVTTEKFFLSIKQIDRRGRYDKEYDDGKGRRRWRCKHRGDTETKTIQSSKYGYSKRYWKCKYRSNMTQTSDSSESREYEPQSLMDEIMESIANP